VSELLSRITGLAVDDPMTIVHIMMLHGQLMVFHAAPKSTMTTIGWDGINAERLAFLKKTVRANARVLMDSWAEEQKSKRR